MKHCDTFDIIFRVIIGFIIIGFLYFVFGFIFSSRPKIMKETDEYIYVKEYSLYNRDSTIYRYHQPIEYPGIVTHKRKSGHFVGVVGKGGHHVTDYYIGFEFDNKRVEINDRNLYDKFETNERIKAIEYFWPHHKYDYLKNGN